MSLKPLKNQLFIFFVFFCITLSRYIAQPIVFRENNKWGIKDNGNLIVKPVYDSVFNFSVSNKVCLACHKTVAASQNKFIKSLTKVFLCNYRNHENSRLIITTDKNDTTSVFTLGKNTIKQLRDNPSFFVVSVKSKKYLIDKFFNQITYKGYHDILYTEQPDLIIVQNMDLANTIFWGLINLKEELIVPFQYSEIKINTNDSLIIACSAGVRASAEDDIFNYQGKKIAGYSRHIDMATKNFVIHKIFEPKEYFIVYNINTREEKILNAEEVKFYNHDEILIRMKNDWYVYNMLTNEKKRNNIATIKN